MTARAECTFVLKEAADGKLFIVAEPTVNLSKLRGLLGFELADGITMNQAHELVKAMRSSIRSISIT